jgi:hypothetical protein
MKATTTVFHRAGTAFALLLACSCTPSTEKSGGRFDGGGADGLVAARADGASVGFTAAACKADTCTAEATKCGWGNSDAKYLGCLSDCDNLGFANARCPDQAAALYTCASLGAKVDCTTGKGTGCSAEEQQVVTCMQARDGGG